MYNPFIYNDKFHIIEKTSSLQLKLFLKAKYGIYYCMER